MNNIPYPYLLAALFTLAVTVGLTLAKIALAISSIENTIEDDDHKAWPDAHEAMTTGSEDGLVALREVIKMGRAARPPPSHVGVGVETPVPRWYH